MEIDELFKEILEYTVETIQKKHSISETEAQRLLVIALDENEFEVFRSIETALRNKKWFATAPERVLANKRLEADPKDAGRN